MLVSSFDRFGSVAPYDPATGRLGPERAVEPAEVTHGHYGAIAGTTVVLYRESGVLHLRVGERQVPLGSGTAIGYEVVDAGCVLTIGPELELRYPAPPEWDGLEDDLTPFVEAEHFEFGLFIANVLRDRARAERIYH